MSEHQPCDIQGGCGSSDGMVVYENGKHCFVCEKTEMNGAPSVSHSDAQFTPVEFNSYVNTSRCLTVETQRKFNYGEVSYKGDWVQITNLRNQDGEITGQKIRTRNKDFLVIGSMPDPVTFWGQHLFNSGKKLVITEGEIDAMSVSQVFDNKYPVVSLPNGCASAAKVIKANLKWLDGFDEIVLCLDSDEPGQEATRKVLPLFKPGHVKVAALPLKDANEMLKNQQEEGLRSAIYNAQTWRPDSILGGDDLWSEYSKTINFTSINFPHSGMTELLAGWRDSEITLIGAGSGSGKSTFIKELCAAAIRQGDKVGAIFLEEAPKRTVNGFITAFIDKPLNVLIQGNLSSASPELQEEIKTVFNEKIKPNLEVYNHFGVLDPDILVNTFRYMVVSLGCKTLILDHITMLGNTSEDGSERTVLDSTFNKLRAMVQETGARMIVVSHLNRPKGRPYEEGAQIHLGSFRGTTQLVCLSDNVIGLERNQQHPKNKDYTHIRVLKCRITGDTGSAGWMFYDKNTGRMKEAQPPDGGILGNQEEESETY